MSYYLNFFFLLFIVFGFPVYFLTPALSKGEGAEKEMRFVIARHEAVIARSHDVAIMLT